MEIEYKGRTYKFLESLSFREAQHIIESYNKKLFFKNKYWWYKKNDFGVYFLNKIAQDPPFLPEIDKKDWYLFIPVLKNFFPTITDHKNVVHNLWFWEGLKPSPIEDSYFLKYIMLKVFASISLRELENMEYKEFIILYKYIIGERVFKLFKQGKAAEKEMKGFEKFKNMVS